MLKKNGSKFAFGRDGLTALAFSPGARSTIAPLPSDVWSHKALLKVVSHTPVEVEALDRLKGSNDWVDLGRHFHPAPARLHTWWSYRSPDWTVNDRGRRLDHMWATADVARQATAHTVFEECRSWLKPSDHVPIMTEFDL